MQFKRHVITKETVVVTLGQNNQTIHASPDETNEEQIIHGYLIDGTKVQLWPVLKLSMVCLHNAFVGEASGLLDCIVGHPNCASAPSILLVLLEPYCL